MNGPKLVISHKYCGPLSFCLIYRALSVIWKKKKKNENRIGRFAGIFVREFGSSFSPLSLSLSHIKQRVLRRELSQS
jgi:hypothetical protein